MTRILVATHNSKKRRELKTLLKSFKGTRVMNLDDLDVQPPIIVEDGKTFRQNAVKKAVTISRFFDGLVLADDSGLEVVALDGRPGVRSARFARVKATDIENNKKLLKLLNNVPEKNRQAKFVCHIA
ncbi:non-canonical purine NTP pyrophosphatase, partial [Candidatus Omnitrophota bacterium]